jgi:hypothetical protein
LINLESKQEINDEWEQIQTATVDAARDVIPIQGKAPGINDGVKNARKSFKIKKEARKN